MTRTPLLLIPAVAALALAACNNDGHTIVQNRPADPMANEIANAGPVELPPSIAASKVYRCKDNSVVYLDWLEKNGQPAGANFRTERTGTPTQLLPGEGGEPPFTAAGGFSLTGTSDASTVTLARPGKDSQSCRA